MALAPYNPIQIGLRRKQSSMRIEDHLIGLVPSQELIKTGSFSVHQIA
jgi:hypothetical protein